MKKQRNYIDGQWRAPLTKEYLYSINPNDTGHEIGRFPRSGKEDVSVAVRSAESALESWSGLSRVNRAEYFDKFIRLMQKDVDDLALTIAMESGKPYNEGRADVIEAIHMMQYCFGSARQPSGLVMSSEIPSKDAYILRKPVGVIAAITPWNFPVAIPLWLIGPSILEGNVVVFKPSEETPFCAQRIFEYFHKAGFPPGVVNLLQGFGEEAGSMLVRHPRVDLVLFTGSYEVGMDIKKVCAGSVYKECALEMGGKNAIIVCADADLELAVNASVISAYKTAGQRCVSAGKIIVHKSILEKFESKFVAASKSLRIGDPVDEETFMGPLVNYAGIEKVEHYNEAARTEVEHARSRGARILLEGKRLKRGKYKNGYYMSPFVYRLPFSEKSVVLKEEVFGPHVAIVPFQTLDDAVKIYNATDYGLAMSVITEDFRKARFCRNHCDYGIGYHNLPCIGAEVHLPFGGVKKSGNGRPSAATLIDAVTHKVAWTVNHSSEIKMAQGLDSKFR